MFEALALDALMIRMMAEFVKQMLPVCAVFAGVTLAVAFVQSGPGDYDARDRILRLLNKSSMSMICALCASALFLAKFGVIEATWRHVAERNGWSEPMITQGADLLLEDTRVGLVGLWLVATIGLSLGLLYAMRAIGESGFLRNESEAKLTQRLKVVGLVVIALCWVLWLMW